MKYFFWYRISVNFIILVKLLKQICYKKYLVKIGQVILLYVITNLFFIYFNFSQQIHASEKDFVVASSLLAVGVDYSHISNANYTRVLFLLSRCMLMLIDKKFADVHPLLTTAGHQVENWQGSPHQKEYLKVYYLVLQVCHFLMAGQVIYLKKILNYFY